MLIYDYKLQTSQFTQRIRETLLAHKYDQKARKCVGVVVEAHLEKGQHYIDLNWMYVEQNWFYDNLIAAQLRDNFPFGQVSKKYR